MVVSLASVEGAKELRKRMKQAGWDLRHMREPHRKIGAVVLPATRAGCPVRSGRLAKTTRASAANTNTVIRAGTKAVPYAPPIHWGWHRRGIKPTLFASKAAQQTEGTWREIYFTECIKILNQIKGKP